MNEHSVQWNCLIRAAGIIKITFFLMDSSLKRTKIVHKDRVLLVGFASLCVVAESQIEGVCACNVLVDRVKEIV